MATTMIVERPGTSWISWLGWGLFWGILGVSGGIIHDWFKSKPAPTPHVTLKPVVSSTPVPGVEEPLWGLWETLDASEPTSTFRVEYRTDGTFVARPLEDAGEAIFLGHPLPVVGIAGTYSARRVGNGLKVQHRTGANELPMPPVLMTSYGRTASIRVPGDKMDSWVRLGRAEFDPTSETKI